MNTSTAKIGLILALVIILPTMFFSVYEISNFKRNQQVIDSIYSSQLSSIVFSLNEYSNNAVVWHAEAIDVPELATQHDSVIHQLFKQAAAVNFCFFASTQGIDTLIGRNDSLINQQWLEESIQKHQDELQKLPMYLNTGYRKIQPVLHIPGEYTVVMFALQHVQGEYKYCGLVLDAKVFVQEVLSPKIQYMAQNKFFISVLDARNNSSLMNNELFDENEHRIRIREELWLFPGLEIGIQLNNDPIEQLVNKRSRISTVLIILMNGILLLGAWFVFRSIRQEVKLARIKSDFVSNVSHELKTPLALISMYSETLDLGRIKDPQRQKEYIGVIHNEAGRLSRMVNKILNFSKIESGKREYHFAPININQLVQEINANYQYYLQSKGCTCHLKLSEQAVKINGDSEAITDAINNLVDNALKYSEDSCSISISTGVKNNMAFIEVQDQGVGIAAKEQKAIFEKFYRVSSGDLAYKAKGSGIGLSIVKHIIDVHKGNITVQSAPGKGSTFTLWFPVEI